MGRFKHFTGYPVLSPWGGPFAGRGGAVSGPQRRRFIFPKRGLRRLRRVLVLPAGSIGQEKGDDPCRFLNAYCSRCQHRPVPHI